MRVRFAFACLLILFANLVIAHECDEEMEIDTTTLVFDENPALSLPRNFRTSTSPLSDNNGKEPNLEGLRNIAMSGSAQFSEHSLKGAIEKMKGEIYIVDLRRESHAFINGLPISWYAPGNASNIEESDDDIMRMEDMLVRDIKTQKGLFVYNILEKKCDRIVRTDPVNVPLESVQTEFALLNKYSVGYIRLGVLDHHRPNDKVVDAFVDFMKSLPQNAWVHFHCRGGRGRTTTFMIMVDMLKNAKTVPFDDIIRRQHLIGGSDVRLVNLSADKKWKEEAARKRLQFLRAFYIYASDKKGYPYQSWTQWRKTAPMKF